MESAKKFLRKVTEFDKGGIAGEVKFILGNDQEIVVKMDEVSDANKYHASVHGISQRLGDSCAPYSKDSNFAKAYEELTSLAEQMKTDKWNREREGGISRQLTEDLIAALTKLKKQDEDVVRAAVEKLDDVTFKKWVANSKVNAEIQEIRSKRAAAAKKASNDSIDDIDLGV